VRASILTRSRRRWRKEWNRRKRQAKALASNMKRRDLLLSCRCVRSRTSRCH
jgi:hypothetical protein